MHVRLVPRTVLLLRDAAGFAGWAWLALMGLQGLVPAIAVFLSRPLVDALAATAGAGDAIDRALPVAGLALALVACAFPAFVVVLRFAMLEHEMRRRTTSDERRSWYYDGLMTSAEAAPEVRVFALGPGLRNTYDELRARIRANRMRLARDQFAWEALAAAATLALAGACVAWVGWRVLAGGATLGDVALFYFAFSQGQGVMRGLLAGVGQVYHHLLFLGNLFAFLDLESRVLDPAQPRALATEPRPGLPILFDDVTFQYPGTDRNALRNFTLAIPAGKMVAIVGPNGAGKSTLLKLLCRFYDPQSGRVCVGDTDVRDLRLDDLRSRMTVLFQQPMRFHDTVAQNVLLRSGDAHEAARAISAAGADSIVGRLPAGVSTILGRWFGSGIDLSLGEWQRIALARAFARQSPLILLDEPTSAMDSWAEADWMTRFRSIAAGRTAVVITHRFTTAMQADVIHVMEDGRVVESGTHQELVRLGGRYATSWRSQARPDPARSHG